MITPLAKRNPPAFSRRQHFIDGRLVEGEGDPLRVSYPVSGEVLIELRSASSSQVDAAVAAARRSFQAGRWRRLPRDERGRVLREIGRLLLARKDALVERILFDNGKTRIECEGDIFAAAAACSHAADACCRNEELRPASQRGVRKRVVRDPVGVVAGITPFNGPLMYMAQKAAPAIAAGNSVVLKPSEKAPLVCSLFCEIATEAGVPSGVLNLVHGPVVTAAGLAAHPGVDMVTLTGGSRAGGAVMRAAAGTIKNLLLGLAGKSAHIVLAEADLDRAVPAIAAGIFRNAGQRCFSGSRLVVEESVAEEVEARVATLAEELVVGDPFEPTTQVGSMIDQRAVERVEAFVARARAEGLELRAGGARPEGLGGGAFYRPTLLCGSSPEGFAAQEEIFGPVLTSIRVADAEEAVQVANRSRYGLAGGVWCRDEAKAMNVAREVRAGYLWINTYSAIFGDVPFGGYGRSGIGREAGMWSYRAYTEEKTILLDTTGGETAPIF